MPNWYEVGLAAFIAVLAWLFKREIHRIDDIENREEQYVTRAELDKTIKQWGDDRKEKHQQNVDTLARIERKIDENETRSATTRHDIRDKVQTLATQVAVLTSRLNDGRDRQ